MERVARGVCRTGDRIAALGALGAACCVRSCVSALSLPLLLLSLQRLIKLVDLLHAGGQAVRVHDDDAASQAASTPFLPLWLYSRLTMCMARMLLESMWRTGMNSLIWRREKNGRDRDTTPEPARARFAYSLVESSGLPEPPRAAAPRLGRRTALTFPLVPPPQKN